MDLPNDQDSLHKRGVFISLEGIDGAGKSSTVDHLTKFLDFVPVHKKAVSSDDLFVNEQIQKIKSANYPGFDGKYDHRLGTNYWIYLQGVWYSLIFEYSILPHLKKGETVIVDGWYYKFIAKVSKELEYPDSVKNVFSLLPKPDLVVFLDIDPILALDRKKSFLHYEAGSHTGMLFSADNFLKFQTYVRERLQSMIESNWSVLNVNEFDTQELISCKVNDLILAHIDRTNGSS